MELASRRSLDPPLRTTLHHIAKFARISEITGIRNISTFVFALMCLKSTTGLNLLFFFFTRNSGLFHIDKDGSIISSSNISSTNSLTLSLRSSRIGNCFLKGVVPSSSVILYSTLAALIFSFLLRTVFLWWFRRAVNSSTAFLLPHVISSRLILLFALLCASCSLYATCLVLLHFSVRARHCTTHNCALFSTSRVTAWLMVRSLANLLQVFISYFTYTS